MQTDAALIDQVISGDEAAFAELHRRHGSTAWRFAQGVSGDAPAASTATANGFARALSALRAGHLDRAGSFRSYLLTGTRNALLESPAVADDDTDDDAADGEDDVVTTSFRALPERWRSILWLTEVETMATKEAAVLLGLSAKGAAQLAARARTGLHERILQAHVRSTSDPACRRCIDRLASHLGGGLSARDNVKVDEHLATCETCATRRTELVELGAHLGRTALPMPLTLAATSAAAVAAAVAAPVAPALSLVPTSSITTRATSWARTPPTWFQKAVAASSVAVLAVGVASIGFYDVEEQLADLAQAPTAPAVALPAPVTIDLAGQLSSPTLSSTETVGAAVRRAGTTPARPTTATAAEGRVAASSPAPSDPGVVASSPAPAPDVDSPVPTSPIDEGPAGAVPVPPAPLPTIPPSPVPLPAPIPDPGSVIDRVADAVSSSISNISDPAPTEEEPAPAPTAPVTETVTEIVTEIVEAVPEPVAEPVETIVDSLPAL